MPESTQNTSADWQSQLAGRPIGFVQPAGGPGLLAMRAIEECRLAKSACRTGKAGLLTGKASLLVGKASLLVADAQRHAADITEDAPDTRIWRALLLGLIAIEQGELNRAEPLLLEASALALDGPGPGCLPRVGARVLVHLGWLYRRTERCAEASRVHLTAHQIREDHGSYEEIWESATELGLDADVARSFETGQRWHREAVEAAEKAHQEPLKKQALAWTNLVTSHEAAEQVDEAVEVARIAQRCWRQFDSAAVTAVRADARLGRALLKKGERLCDVSEAGLPVGDSGHAITPAVEVLAEAVNLLATARDGLLAFGLDYRNEADSCHDQEELATRLTSEWQRLDESVHPDSSSANG